MPKTALKTEKFVRYAQKNKRRLKRPCYSNNSAHLSYQIITHNVRLQTRLQK